MRRETLQTFKVAFLLCVVCSLVVSATAVGLRSAQITNRQRFMEKNILIAAGFSEQELRDEPTFRRLADRVERRLVVLGERRGFVEPGEFPEIDVTAFDPRRAARDPELRVGVPHALDLASIRYREPYAFVYLLRDEDKQEIEQLILPVYGMGLWGTLYGFLAIDYGDLSTVQGLSFYEHQETPGLGGEVDNVAWKAQWEGIQPFNPEWDVVIRVAPPGRKVGIHEVDGLAGATITSRGVERLIHYWLGDHAFGPFLEWLREERSLAAPRQQAEGGGNG